MLTISKYFHVSSNFNKFLLYFSFFLLQPLLVCSKGGGGAEGGSSSSSFGGSGSSSSSRSSTSTLWVFWYYDPDGVRKCGNYCIVMFSIVGVLILCIILCGFWRCYMIRKFYKDDRIHNDYESAFVDFMHEHEMATNNHNRNQVELQYPPLAHTTPADDPPPAYDTAYGEKSHLHGLRHNASYEAYKVGRQFTRDNPPHEILPPKEHIAYILSNGGAKAWKMVAYVDNAQGSSGSSSVSKDIASISDDGRIITFHGKNDSMVQANYPLFRPQLDGDDSLQSNSNIVTSSTSNNMSTSPDLPPDYEQSTSSERQISSSNWDQNLEPWFYYFEITIISNPNKKGSTLAIGLTTKPYPSFRLPGWNKHSVGYHSDDGYKFNNDGLGGLNYGEKWGEVGDTIGCGYYPDTGIVFFTKNGISQGNAFSGLKHIWFPTVGADNKCKMDINFGDGTKEFQYREARGMSVSGPIILPPNG